MNNMSSSLSSIIRLFTPSSGKSQRWLNWIAMLDMITCSACRKNHGKIYSIEESGYIEPPLHPRCRCEIDYMNAIVAGRATRNGDDGADYWLKHYQILPDHYISKTDLIALGWKPGNWPSSFVDNMMVFGGVYNNLDGHLPNSIGRTWYEADINYIYSFRNASRILFSNDGLIFVTYDHYSTFNEII